MIALALTIAVFLATAITAQKIMRRKVTAQSRAYAAQLATLATAPTFVAPHQR